MVGSSIVKNAFIVARERPGGINLGLSKINAEIWWQGIRGMVIEQIKKQIVTMLQYEDPPNYIFLHVSANNIGHSKIGHIRNQLIKVITKLPNSEQSYKGKVKTHNYINRQNQSTTGKL